MRRRRDKFSREHVTHVQQHSGRGRSNYYLFIYTQLCSNAAPQQPMDYVTANGRASIILCAPDCGRFMCFLRTHIHPMPAAVDGVVYWGTASKYARTWDGFANRTCIFSHWICPLTCQNKGDSQKLCCTSLTWKRKLLIENRSSQSSYLVLQLQFHTHFIVALLRKHIIIYFKRIICIWFPGDNLCWWTRPTQFQSLLQNKIFLLTNSFRTFRVTSVLMVCIFRFRHVRIPKHGYDLCGKSDLLAYVWNMWSYHIRTLRWVWKFQFNSG